MGTRVGQRVVIIVIAGGGVGVVGRPAWVGGARRDAQLADSAVEAVAVRRLRGVLRRWASLVHALGFQHEDKLSSLRAAKFS